MIRYTTTSSYEPIDIEHFCARVIHLTSGGNISKYKELANNKERRELWITAFGKEFGSLVQGDSRIGEMGSNAIFILDHEVIKNIPAN